MQGIIRELLGAFGYVKADSLPMEHREPTGPTLTLRDLLKAINRVEDTVQHPDGETFYGDGGNARGPLQIWQGYHTDSVGNLFPYARVDYWRPSLRCFFGYMARYVPQALLDHDFETLARTHNGGPLGAVSIKDHPQGRREKTDPYWAKVKTELDRIKAEKESA